MRDTLNISFTVGIPTYLGGANLVRTVKTIRASEGVGPFRFLVCVDGRPLTADVESELQSLGVEVLYSEQRGGQIARIKQMVTTATTDVIVLTQDDVLFTPRALAEIISMFKRTQSLTMVGANIQPIPATTFFESVVEVGVRMTHAIGERWRNGDNYLMASGRCMAFRTAAIRSWDLPTTVINSDAYQYFVNKFFGGTFAYAKNAVVYNKSPLKVKEHLRQSRRFFVSKSELNHYFKKDLSTEYAPPKNLLIRSLGRELLYHPISTASYLTIELVSKLGQKKRATEMTNMWEPDVSTKR